MTPHELLPHTADVRLRVSAADLAGLFAAAADGLVELFGLESAAGGKKERLELSAPDAEGLLVAWLNELIYRIQSKGLSPACVAVVSCDGRHLAADVSWVERKGRLDREVKAATYGGLAVERKGKKLEATVLFDL
ncbi:MAG: archease [Elusimicrobia bacterium]|nr:archease [Elusimicrobiota bacterium]